MIGHTSGLHVPVSVLNQRLNRPLIGVAAVQNNSLTDALTVCQVVSSQVCSHVTSACVCVFDATNGFNG